MTWKMGPLKNKDEVNVDVHVDSKWTSGPDRKSTSAGMMMINGTAAKHWSRTHATRALSTAEAEYHAVVTAKAKGTWHGVDDGRHGRDHPSASLD